MLSQQIRFLFVTSLFVSYTFLKVVQLWPSEPIPSIIVSILIFVVMLSGMFLYRAKAEVFDKTWFKVLSWSGSMVMALWATMVIVSIPFDVLNLFVTVLEKFNVFANVDPDKMLNAIHGTYVAVFLSSLAMVGLGFLEVVKGPKVKPVSVKIPSLPASLQGLKVAQISDLHVGPTIRKSYVQEVVDRTNATEPDFIFLTGDIVDSRSSSVSENLKPLSTLKAKYGTYYVTGNHEYYWDAQNIFSEIQEQGIQFLKNENKIIKIGDSSVMVAGITDPAGAHALPGHKPDFQKALSSNEHVRLKMLLSHRPSVTLEAEKLGVDIQFSGHTHAGQFFPFSLFIGLAHKYSRGLYKQNRVWVYVNPGTGYWGPADRLGVTAEISLITLEN